MDVLKCLIRNRLVKATPEEKVRQNLLRLMIEQLGYSPNLIILEKKLSQLPHLRSALPTEIPDRRLDLLVMAKGIHPHESLYPLLLVECKAEKITDQALRQVIGYNHFLQAYYFALACSDEIRTGWYDRSLGDYRIVRGLPPFQALVEGIR